MFPNFDIISTKTFSFKVFVVLLKSGHTSLKKCQRTVLLNIFIFGFTASQASLQVQDVILGQMKIFVFTPSPTISHFRK